jgi:hypothetical protein
VAKADEKSGLASGVFNVLKAIATKLADALKHRPEMAAIVLIVVIAASVLRIPAM